MASGTYKTLEVTIMKITRFFHLLKSYIEESLFEGTKMSIKDFIIFLRNVD